MCAERPEVKPVPPFPHVGMVPVQGAGQHPPPGLRACGLLQLFPIKCLEDRISLHAGLTLRLTITVAYLCLEICLFPLAVVRMIWVNDEMGNGFRSINGSHPHCRCARGRGCLRLISFACHEPDPLPRCTAISCSFSHSSYLIFNNYYFKRKPFQARPHPPLTVCC